MTLLDALLRFQQIAEGRRVARKTIREAVDLLEDALTKELRVGDHVTVDGRTLEVRRVGYYGNQGSGWPVLRSPQKFPCLVLDGRVIQPPSGQSWHDGHNLQRQMGSDAIYDVATEEDIALASDTDRTWLAERAAAIVEAFGDALKADRERMTAAAELARTQRV